ncbi:uncharacterized protein LOC119374007 [Rhipicephalus sanguineus]|uniref:uncharacterized protein LOC119374007 n=1 Tax=Rhipicephalus sanguineus TaxID=34632 RepID=UPI001895EFC8|nr:uncharacterized protein LOC119374007 [Rhipicephalus sanguineus]
MTAMRTEVLILLPSLFTVAFGGGPIKEPIELRGYYPDNAGYRNDPSACYLYRGKRHCIFESEDGWHYNWFYRTCFKDDLTHCGVGENKFHSCEQCVNKCRVSVCAEKAKPPPSWSPPFTLGGM